MKESVVEIVAGIENENFTDPWTSQMLLDTLKYDYNFIILLTKDELLVCRGEGCINQFEVSDVIGYLIGNVIAGESELLRIAVARKYKGCGHSKTIMEKYFQHTSENYFEKCENYFLEVRSQNKIAINLYKSMGYEQIGCRRNYYSNPNDDALIFKK